MGGFKFLFLILLLMSSGASAQTPTTLWGNITNDLKNASKALLSAGRSDTNCSSCATSDANNASEAESNVFTLSTDRSLDSSVVVTGKLKSSTAKIWIKVTKESKNINVYPIITNRSFSKKIYLSFGPGTYNIQIGTQESGLQSMTYIIEKNFLVENADLKNNAFLLPSENVQSDDPRITSLAQRITRNIANPYEKSRAIHDWIARNIAYDVNAIYKGSTGETLVVENYSTDATGTLIKQQSVCSGYANLNAALHRAISIPAKVVIGDALNTTLSGWVSAQTPSSHAWNEIFVDNRWIIQDVTWDAGTVDGNLFTFRHTYKYFDIKKIDFDLDHRKLEELDD